MRTFRKVLRIKARYQRRLESAWNEAITTQFQVGGLAIFCSFTQLNGAIFAPPFVLLRQEIYTKPAQKCAGLACLGCVSQACTRLAKCRRVPG